MFPTPYNSAEYQSLSLSKTPKINDLSIWTLLNHIPIRAFISLFIRFLRKYTKFIHLIHLFCINIYSILHITLFFSYLHLVISVYLYNKRCIFFLLPILFSHAFCNVLVTSNTHLFYVKKCEILIFNFNFKNFALRLLPRRCHPSTPGMPPKKRYFHNSLTFNK